MANTYSQIYIQVVFAVKGRLNLIAEKHREELQKFIGGIVNNRNQKMMAIYCMPNHTHILLSLSPNLALADLVRDIKAGSSKFINEQNWVKGKFAWQEGYGAFSYSQSQVQHVIDYILNQEEHHKSKSFKEEYTDFLNKFQIDYKSDYLFDWVEN